jgi:hypothetical protein
MSMQMFRIAIALLLLSAPAMAQKINLMGNAQPKTMEQIEREKAVEEAYKAKMNAIPDQKGSSDPWATVRTAPSASNQKSNRK